MSPRVHPLRLAGRTHARTGAELTRFNALRHGVLSRYTVLPWESESEYQDLLHALADEHQPRGPTEEHLVEELAGVLWRKRRLRQAEASTFRRGLAGAQSSLRGTAGSAVSHLRSSVSQEDVAEAIHLSAEDTQADIADLDADEAQTQQALVLLQTRGDAALEEAVALLREDTCEWWQDVLINVVADREPYTPDAASLIRFLQEEVGDWYNRRRTELEHRPLIQSQAYGDALEPTQLEKLSRYEIHLDRKLERTLSMLLKLQDLRREVVPA